MKEPLIMTSNINSSYTNQYNYNYHIATNPGTPVNVNVSVTPGQPQGYKFIVDPKNNSTISGKPPYNSALKPKNGLKESVKRILRPLKIIKPAHIIMIGVVSMPMMLRTCGSMSASSAPATHQQAPAPNANAMEKIYKMGEQHIRDSIKVAEMEKELKLAQDSIKMLKKLPK